MGRLANSWTVFKQSLSVLRQDKELLILPVFSGIAALLAMGTFFFPAYTTGLVERVAQTDPVDENARITVGALFLVLYFLLAFIAIFFQAALIHGANERLSGGDPTVGSALRGASSRLGKILLWSLFAATVGLLIHAVENAMRRGGHNLAATLVSRILGTAWTLMTFFVVPVLLFEERGTFASLGRSGQLFKQRWGESLVGEFGIGLAMTVLTFLGVLGAGVPGMYLLMNGLVSVGLALLAAAFLWVVFMAILGQALNGVYKAALYRFAQSGQPPPFFQPHVIEGAYRPTYTTPDRM